MNISWFVAQNSEQCGWFLASMIVLVVSLIVCVIAFIESAGLKGRRRSKHIAVGTVTAILFVVSLAVVANTWIVRCNSFDTLKDDLNTYVSDEYGISLPEESQNTIINRLVDKRSKNKDVVITVSALSQSNGDLVTLKCMVVDDVLMFFDEDGNKL